eukprot:TRINITY_DN5477_c0_g1_i4.p1 TRINITY_DN5477_c0_g1~~TRINITY_DN5477_c0_g1_i4.p1  ORF type:complete len:100 (+),score=8.79 TRINITY_DN5477_c0_g1_i4:104-403(+)
MSRTESLYGLKRGSERNTQSVHSAKNILPAIESGQLQKEMYQTTGNLKLNPFHVKGAMSLHNNQSMEIALLKQKVKQLTEENQSLKNTYEYLKSSVDLY